MVSCSYILQPLVVRNKHICGNQVLVTVNSKGQLVMMMMFMIMIIIIANGDHNDNIVSVRAIK